MEKFTTIQLKLPKSFNYRLDVHIAKLKRDGALKQNKSKAQILISLAEIGLAQESKNVK